MKSLASLRQAMDACEQMPGMSVYEHGVSVNKYFLDLLSHLRDGTTLQYEWRLPDWVSPALLDQLLPVEILNEYQIYHDCGKPFCRMVDQNGRRHFQDHASMSRQIWLEHGGSAQSARLMGMDMDAHLLKAEGVEEFAARPEAVSLLLTALAEIHSNAAMFGGIESTSFKIKWKQLDRRGRAIVAKLLP